MSYEKVSDELDLVHSRFSNMKSIKNLEKIDECVDYVLGIYRTKTFLQCCSQLSIILSNLLRYKGYKSKLVYGYLHLDTDTHTYCSHVWIKCKGKNIDIMSNIFCRQKTVIADGYNIIYHVDKNKYLSEKDCSLDYDKLPGKSYSLDYIKNGYTSNSDETIENSNSLENIVKVYNSPNSEERTKTINEYLDNWCKQRNKN